VDNYAAAWGSLMHQVRNGYSWSGGERNRLFLNGTQGRFFDASATSGFDFPDDGRALALVDWDLDGRLDIWLRNRTAPRLRLLRNVISANDGETISIRLQGVTCNRDGIGAVVELVGENESAPKLVRSVRAGDLFLSQSSNRLHFGTAGIGKIKHAVVRWPGGGEEIFTGLSKGERVTLKQGMGTGLVSSFPHGKLPDVAGGDRTPTKDDGIARIILPSRVPLPKIVYRNQVAQVAQLTPDGKPRLLLIWSGTCPHCKRQLGQLTKDAERIAGAGLEVLALATDGMAGPASDVSATYDVIDGVGVAFPWGLIDAASVGRIQKLQAALFDRTPAASVPLGILLDEGGRAVAIYRGPFSTSDVLQDYQSIRGADEKQLYHLAPPLKGRWFTNPLPQSQVSEFLRLD